MVTSDVIGGLIGEIASLQEESARVCKPLQDRLEKTRQLLKDAMVEADTIESIDEVSGYRALIRQTYSDDWVAEKLLPLLRLGDAERVIDTKVYIKADEMKALINAGVVTRSRLEQEGALVRRLRARQLIIEPLRGLGRDATVQENETDAGAIR